MGRRWQWLVFLMMTISSASAEEDFAWMVGAESELALRQPMVLTDDRRLLFPGDYRLEDLRVGLSASGEARLGWHPFWLGIRGSLWFGSLSGVFVAFPRFNLTARWEVTDWCSVGLEAPYNPGLGVLLLQKVYLFYGASDLFGERDYAFRSFAVLWRTPF